MKPFVQISPSQLETLIAQYKAGNLSSFEQLNTVIQKSILRAREYRKELLKNPDLIFHAAEKLSGTNNEWLDPDLNRLFASDDKQLKERIKEQMADFIQAEQKGTVRIRFYAISLKFLYSLTMH